MERDGADGGLGFFRGGDPEDGDGEGEKRCAGGDVFGEAGGGVEVVGVVGRGRGSMGCNRFEGWRLRGWVGNVCRGIQVCGNMGVQNYGMRGRIYQEGLRDCGRAATAKQEKE